MRMSDSIERRLQRLDRPPIPPQLRERVLRAAGLILQPAPRSLRVGPTSWRLGLVALTATVALAVALGLLLPWGDRREDSVLRTSSVATVTTADDVVVLWLDEDTPVYVEMVQRSP
jgi:hypothetical protein